MRSLWKREELETRHTPVTPLYDTALLEPQVPETSILPGAAEPAADNTSEAVARHLRLLNGLATALVRERARLLTELRPEVLRLTVLVAREIIGREVALDPSLIERTLEEALQRLNEASHIVARLHPEDLAFLRERAASLPEGQRGPPLELVADESVARGGCRLDSERGSIDATLETQLRLIHEALQGEGGGAMG